MCIPEQAVEAKGHLGTNWDLHSWLPQLPSRWNLCWTFCGWMYPAAFSFSPNAPSLFISIIYASLLLSLSQKVTHPGSTGSFSQSPSVLLQSLCVPEQLLQLQTQQTPPGENLMLPNPSLSAHIAHNLLGFLFILKITLLVFLLFFATTSKICCAWHFFK